VAGKYIYFDIETHGIEKRWDMSPREYFRLGQYAWDDGEVVLTTDYDEMIEQIRKAPYVIGHNIHSFDLSVLFGTDSIEPLKMTQDKRVIDTMVLATLLTPAPYEFRMSSGRYVKDANHPGSAMLWYGLDNLCHQFRLGGKFGDLRELAKKHNPEKTPLKELDFGLIPLDDPEFLEYARQDVVAVRELFYHLMRTQEDDPYPSEYLWREQEIHAVLAQMSRNGIRPNKELAESRSAEQQQTVKDTMDWLHKEFDFPTEGKAPWKSNAGKAAILKALAAYGITPDHEEWERTAKGNPSFSGDVMLAVTEGTDAQELGQALAQLQGLRSMPDLILSSIRGDGRMHPDFTAFQKSGRFSVYNPSILIFNAEHKDLLLADEGCYTVEVDLSNADARAVAAMSGDEEFALRFETNPDGTVKYDGHNLSGEVFFGGELYHRDCGENCGKGCKPALRPAAKAATLSLGYNVGPRKLAQILNKAAKAEELDIEFWCSDETYWSYKKEREAEGKEAWPEGEWLASIRLEGKIHTRELIRNYNLEYAAVKAWKDRVVREGDDKGFVTNSWGRRMPIDFAGVGWDAPEGRRSRAYTQGPALMGQSTTREIVSDGLIAVSRESEYYARALRGVIHDAIVFDFQKDTFDKDVETIVNLIQTDLHPGTRTGQTIPFPVGVGPKGGLSWATGSH